MIIYLMLALTPMKDNNQKSHIVPFNSLKKCEQEAAIYKNTEFTAVCITMKVH